MSAVFFVMLLGVASADAEELAARAHKAEADLDYEEAARAWLQVLALDDLPDHRRVEGHLQLATAFVILDDKEGARFHYRRALVSNPLAALAPHAPAKARVVFEDVKNELRTTSQEKKDRGPWLAGAVALTAGVAAAATSGVLFALGAVTESDALDEPEQLKRDALYDRRDTFIYSADAVAVGSVALLAVAAGAFALVGWSAALGLAEDPAESAGP